MSEGRLSDRDTSRYLQLGRNDMIVGIHRSKSFCSDGQTMILAC